LEKYVEQFGLSPETTLVYACGHPGMIEDVKVRGARLGFTVQEERFWVEGEGEGEAEAEDDEEDVEDTSIVA
jgi:NAD(P)H-flavin reductase